MDRLDTGVVLCQLAEEIQERMILTTNGKVLTYTTMQLLTLYFYGCFDKKHVLIL